MWYHQFKTAVRQLGKNKFFTLVHISGLAIGISAALIVYIMVSHELSYNKGIIGNERVFRIVSDIQYPDMLIKNGGVPAPLGRVVGGEVPGIEASTAMFQFYEPRVTLPAPSGQSPRVLLGRPQVSFVDATYFGFVPHEWLAGSPATSLSNPYKVVLSREVMEEYFPGWQPEQVMGQVLTYEDDLQVTVSGIVSSKAGKHSFQVSEMISMPTIVAADLTSNYSWDRWDNINSASQLLVRLLPNASAESLPGQLAMLLKKYHPDDKYNTTLGVQLLSDVHFNSDYQAFYARVAHKPTLYGLMLVALFLLLLGCINFINLSTAQSAQRAREIGIRKTLGSSRWQLTKQFLAETWLLTFIAVLLAMLAGPVLLKLFRDFIPNDIDASLLYQRGVVLFLFVLSVVVTLLAGLYPSWVLNRVIPVAVLKNQVVTTDGQSRKAMLRKVLIVFQFFIAQCFLIGVWVVGRQIHYGIHADMGFRTGEIVTIATPWNDHDYPKRASLLQELESLPGVKQAALGGHPPATNGYNSTMLAYVRDGQELQTMVEVKNAGEAYRDIYQIKLLAGRWAVATDTTETEYVINETYARMLGFDKPGDAIGKTFTNGTTICGVVADFLTKSIHSATKPLAFLNVRTQYRTFHLLLNANTADGLLWKQTLEKAGEKFRSFYPDTEYSYMFTDERIAGFYAEEKKLAKLLNWAAGLSGFISLLGLLGLVVYISLVRQKEIGIRKVLGASVAQIMGLLSKEMAGLVLLSGLIAAPVAGYFSKQWLMDFAYRTTVPWWLYVVSGAAMLMMAAMVLGLRTWWIARENPVNSLKNE